MDVRRKLEALLRQPIPILAEGDTAVRWATLYRWARTGSVSVARLAEAHLDAISIFLDANQTPEPDCIYGVWASGGPSDTTLYNSEDKSLTGGKPFASGVGVVDRALVTARDLDGANWLLDVDVSDLPLPEPWATPALVDTCTGHVALETRRAKPVGKPDFYLDRVNFWHGAVGPAACWAGAASGIVDFVTEELAEDPYRRAAQGKMLAQQWLLEAMLRQNGEFIDADSASAHVARAQAHTVRHLIERSCATIVDSLSQAFGPRPFTSDPELAQRVMDVQLYCRQQHGDRDLAALAKAAYDGALL